ncbi:MAG: hypothetical protein COB96_07140 [Planctomycetota bacterium]|nr:MAG: hypothetical protein COB96_07140 [Planctomycetota bacterium]
MSTPLVHYSHRQAPVWMWFAFGGLIGIGIISWLAGGWIPLVNSIFIVAILLVVLFNGLKVEVDNEKINLIYGLGLIHRNIDLSSLAEVSVVRNKWWYGFGIRLTPHGWMWNISGLDAIELEYRNGKRFRIGSNEPAALRDSIQSVLPTPK